jgi:hypothetical protein
MCCFTIFDLRKGLIPTSEAVEIAFNRDARQTPFSELELRSRYRVWQSDKLDAATVALSSRFSVRDGF